MCPALPARTIKHKNVSLEEVHLRDIFWGEGGDSWVKHSSKSDSYRRTPGSQAAFPFVV